MMLQFKAKGMQQVYLHHDAFICVRKMLEMCYISIRLLDKICKKDYIFL